MSTVTGGVPEDPGATVTVTVDEGDDYTVGARRSATISVPADSTSAAPPSSVPVLPSVSIEAASDSAVEGESVSFTLTARPGAGVLP